MGRTSQFTLPAEVSETLKRIQAWRSTRKNGDGLPESLWEEAAGLARRLGVNRVCRPLGLNHTALKRRAEASPMVEPASLVVQPTFVDLGRVGLENDVPAGPRVEIMRPDGARMMMSWPSGATVDAGGLVTSFLAVSPGQAQGRWAGVSGR